MGYYKERLGEHHREEPAGRVGWRGRMVQRPGRRPLDDDDAGKNSKGASAAMRPKSRAHTPATHRGHAVLGLAEEDECVEPVLQQRGVHIRQLFVGRRVA